MAEQTSTETKTNEKNESMTEKKKDAVSGNASRSVVVVFHNISTFRLNRTNEELDHGAWAVLPPEFIEANHAVTFGSESDGFMTGTQGTVTYFIIDGPGSVLLRWDNPYSGGNSYSQSAPKGFDCIHSGGGGNNANVTFILEASSATTTVPNAKKAESNNVNDKNEPVTDEKADKTESAGAARSVSVIFQNVTTSVLLRTGAQLSHGEWTSNMMPPDKIVAHSNVSWGSQSSGFMTGTQGSAEYTMQNTTNKVIVTWDNPYSGPNSYKSSSPQHYQCSHTGGGGDNSSVTFTFYVAPTQISIQQKIKK